MPITFNCPCGKALRVADENAGRRVKCPACQAVGSVPAPEPQFEVVEDEPKPPPPVPKVKPAAQVFVDDDDDARGYTVAKKEGRDDEDEPRAKKKPDFRKGASRRDNDDDDDEDERPKRKQKRGGAGNPDAGKKLMYLIGGLILAVAGIAIALWWYQDGPHTGRRPYSGFILGACCLVVGLGTAVKGITGNFDDDE